MRPIWNIYYKKRETSYNNYHLNIKEFGFLKSKNNIDYTKVETFDKFPQKYMNEPEPEKENPPKKMNEPEEENPKKRVKIEYKKIMN